MATPDRIRKALFRAALVLHDETVDDVATREGVTRGHLYAVFDGQRESRRLSDSLETYIETARKAICKYKVAA